MLSRTLILAAALAALSACDKPADSPTSGGSQKGDAGSTAGASHVPTTPADLPKPSQEEKREGANPTQGQVDPKEAEQHRDFQRNGDAAGPTGPDTTPRK